MKCLKIALFFSLGLTSTSFAVPVATVMQEALPAWAQDGIYKTDKGNYLSIEKVIAQEKYRSQDKVSGSVTVKPFTRAAAVELQGEWKKNLAQGMTSESAYQDALEDVRAALEKDLPFGTTGWKAIDWSKESPGSFVVVFDMDETLLQQWHSDAATKRVPQEMTKVVVDTTIMGADVVGSRSVVKFTPGTDQAILNLFFHPLCKGIVVFSAKLDEAARDIISQWTISGKDRSGKPVKLTSKEFLKGVFVRSHLIVGPGARVPSKDLRIFDESLKHVVIVDDNPGRVFQQRMLRAQPLFDADIHSTVARSVSSRVKQHYDTIIGQAASEIIESAEAAEKTKGLPKLPTKESGASEAVLQQVERSTMEGKRFELQFGDAFLPYAYHSTRVLQAARKNFQNNERAAIEFVRQNLNLTGSGTDGHAVFDFKIQR